MPHDEDVEMERAVRLFAEQLDATFSRLAVVLDRLVDRVARLELEVMAKRPSPDDPGAH